MNNLTLTFLGRDSGFGKKNNSAYIEIDDRLIFIDCGFTVFEQIKEKFDLNKYNTIDVIITHLHNDHAGSLSQVILYAWFICNKKINVISRCDKIREYLDITGTPRNAYNLKDNLESLEFIKTKHTDYLDAYGFKFNINNKKIIYTGDTNILEPFTSYLSDANELYIDVSRYGGAHIQIDSILEKLNEIKNNGTIICLMHLDDREYIREVTNNEFNIE